MINVMEETIRGFFNIVGKEVNKEKEEANALFRESLDRLVKGDILAGFTPPCELNYNFCDGCNRKDPNCSQYRAYLKLSFYLEQTKREG